MKDLHSTKLMWLKAILLLAIGLIAVALVWLETPTWKCALLLALAIWAFCRAYYFGFYVLEKYVDPQFRYSGLGSLLRYIFRHRSK